MRAGFVCFAAGLDLLAILAAAAVTCLFQASLQGAAAEVAELARWAALIGSVYIGQNLVRDGYGFHRCLQRGGDIAALFSHWALAFLGALALAFVIGAIGGISRLATVLLFCSGGLALTAAQAAMTAVARRISRSGVLFTRHVFLVGYEEDIRFFSDRYEPWTLGVNIVGAAVLRGSETIQDDLRLAVASARIFRPDDVFVLMPWHDTAAIDACVDAFMAVPASVHMGPERLLDRYSDANISKIGPIASLRLVRRPLNFVEVSAKRLFDLVVASLALVLLSPLFLIVAIAIKLDSEGPVFFLQTRYGFNQEPFRIVKFRSLAEKACAGGFREVTRGDLRLTRVGSFIRRTNIDELPQLVNVLLGQMSLVGPRPHVMAHDRMFGEKIAQSARRHNVKPGITGWAQAHGFRGEIDTDEKLRGRIEHDLYYIDNWSPWLDLRIMWLTLFSRKAYSNAY